MLSKHGYFHGKALTETMGKRPAKSTGEKQPFKWRPFLKLVSRTLLKDVSLREDLPDDVIDSGWLGYAGAKENEIAELEKCLGKRLPPSYKAFLAETNGWRQCGAFIDRLWPCADVRWFCDRHQDWIDAYLHPENRGIEIVSPEGAAVEEPEPLTDEEYLVYGEAQDSTRIRVEYLQTALEISDVGDSAILLLNPQTVDAAGEWEAWLFANWLPGAHRYRSFRELMEGEHASFLRLRKQLGPSKSKYGNAGQQAARRGQTSTAMRILRRRAAAGDDSSAASLAQLCAFLGQWDEVTTYMGPVILNLGAIRDFEDFPGQLFRLLGRAGHETGRWNEISKLADAAIAAERKRSDGKYPEHVVNSLIQWFKNLKAYCKRRGKPPHDLTRVYAVADPIEQMTKAQRRKTYDNAVKEHGSRLRDKPAEFASYRFSVARNFGLDDEMLRVFEETSLTLRYDDLLEVCRAYMRRKNPQAAWDLLRDRISSSVNGLPEHVAPIILLVDDELRPLMTPERCELVLATPRGREAVQK